MREWVWAVVVGPSEAEEKWSEEVEEVSGWEGLADWDLRGLEMKGRLPETSWVMIGGG